MEVDKVTDEVEDEVAEEVTDNVAHMKVDKVADMKVNMVADTEVNKVADTDFSINFFVFLGEFFVISWWFFFRFLSQIFWIFRWNFLDLLVKFFGVTQLQRPKGMKGEVKGRLPKKTPGKCGNFEKTGGGSTRIPLPFFTVFNMGDLPKINGKIGKKFPNRGEGGVPDLGKIPTFSRFFLDNVPIRD